MANERLIFLACNIYSILAEYSLHSCTFRWALWLHVIFPGQRNKLWSYVAFYRSMHKHYFPAGLEVTDADISTGHSVRSVLMDQIRSGLKLKPVPPSPQKPPKPASSPRGGVDLMGDLFAKLNMRRKGVSGGSRRGLTPPQKSSVDSFISGIKMSFVTRKPVFGVCDQGRLKPACAATEAR